MHFTSTVKQIKMYVPVGAISKAVGQKKKNIIRLKEKFKIADIIVRQDASLADYQIKINL